MAEDRQGLAEALPSFGAADGTLDPRTLLTRLVHAGFRHGVRTLYRVEIVAPAACEIAPGTLIVSNHQRDSDVPVLAVALDWSVGTRLRSAVPYFATREDLLRPGVLGALTEGWPRPLRALLGAIPLRWLFDAARARPMRRVREYTLREASRALAAAGWADAPLALVLNARGRREFGERWSERALGVVCEDRAAPLDAFWGLRRLGRDARSALRDDFRATISRQLRDFAGLLDAGHSLYFAPEGATSDDGRFGRVREGARQIMRLAARAHPVLPLALSYDALAPGRLRVAVRVGALAHDLDPADARGFAAALRQSIARLYPVTASHLIARYLAVGPARFTARELAVWMERARNELAATGRTVDPLLVERPLEPLAEARLRWLAAQRLVARESPHWRNGWPRDSRPGWRTPANVVRYLANTTADLVPELDRTLGR